MENNEWKCPKCGKINTNKFCGACGTKKPEENTNLNPPTAVRKQPILNVPSNMLQNAKPKSKNKLRYILIIIIVVLIGVLAGIYFVNSNKAMENTTDTTTVEQAATDTEEAKTEETKQEEVQSADKEKNKEPAAEQKAANLDYLKEKVVPNAEKQKNTDVSDAGVRFFEYHKSITEHNLRRAYGYLSKDFQNRMTYEGWAPGFDKTLSSNPSNLQLISAEINRVEFSYDLEARDKDNNRVKVQTFKGKTILIKENGNWRIDSIVADKTGEHFE